MSDLGKTLREILTVQPPPGRSKRNVPLGAPRFAITDHKGVQLTFANGIIISIQWGPGNYCADYWECGALEAWDAPARARFWNSPDAEVALFWAGGEREWLTKRAYAELNGGADPGDDVLPALTPDEVARYIAWAVGQPPRAGECVEREGTSSAAPRRQP